MSLEKYYITCGVSKVFEEFEVGNQIELKPSFPKGFWSQDMASETGAKE